MYLFFQKEVDGVMLIRRIFISKQSITASFYKNIFTNIKAYFIGYLCPVGYAFVLYYRKEVTTKFLIIRK